MNFEESNEFVEEMEKNDRKKKKVLTTLIFLAILIVILFAIIVFLRYQDSRELKMYIDDKQVTISSTLLLEEGDQTYISVSELANMLGYSYQNGEYKSYTEDPDSCYIRNQYEIVSMSADSNTVTKYIMKPASTATTDLQENTNTNTTESQLILTDEKTGEQKLNIVVASENETPEIFVVNEPVKYINNELYISFAELPRVFNVGLDIGTKNRIRVYSLNNMIVAATQIATNLEYSVVSNTYENLTAMVDNMLVVGDGTNYGVVSLETGDPVISLQYESIVYMQNTKEFLVSVEGNVGIIAADGKTIIKPIEYDNISKLDELNKLYLVEKDGKYGVLNGEGETIVYVEYEAIGITNQNEFKNEDVRNFSLLFDECIPVTQNGKVGLIDKNGEKRLQCAYDALGYVANTSVISTTEEKTSENKVENETVSNTRIPSDGDSVLTIPENVGIKGIVVNLNGSYGIYDVAAGRLIIPCVYSRIFSRTRSGVTTYYLEYNEEEIELKGYLESSGLVSVNSGQVEEEQEEPVQEENNSDMQIENQE